MACECCTASRETNGVYRLFDPKCIYCGARLIQKIGKLQIAASEARDRRKAVLGDWCSYGHSEKAIRALVRGPAALEPVERRK
jgi:hypothetical protein